MKIGNVVVAFGREFAKVVRALDSIKLGLSDVTRAPPPQYYARFSAERPYADIPAKSPLHMLS